MNDPLSSPLHALGKALLDASASLRELPLAGDIQRATSNLVGFVLDDQVLPRFRSQVNGLIGQHLRRHPGFPLDKPVVNVLDHQHLVVQGVYSHPLPLGAGRCDYDVRMALNLAMGDRSELHLTVTEVQARPTGILGRVAPPLTESEVRTRLLEQLAALPTDGRLSVRNGVIVLNLWQELSALWDKRQP